MIGLSIEKLRTTTSDSIQQAQAPILKRRKKLEESKHKQEVILTGEKRDTLIARLADGDYTQKDILKAAQELINAAEFLAGIDKVLAILERKLDPAPKKKQLETVLISAVSIIETKKARAKLEVDGRATNLHDDRIRSELNSLSIHSKRLLEIMGDMAAPAVSEALEELATEVLNFTPMVTNPDSEVAHVG